MSREYFSDRENGIKIANTEDIQVNVFNGIISVYFEYQNAMALKFPEKDDYDNIKGLSKGKFRERLLGVIPMFTLNFNGWIGSLEEGSDFDKYALLDFIEFCWRNIQDYKNGQYGLLFSDGEKNKIKFRSEINKMFERNSIVFRLSDNGEIERILPMQLEVLVKNYCHTGNDKELNQLIDEAIQNIIKVKMQDRQRAIEKLWDAFERIKTYYGDKKATSAVELIKLASESSSEFEALINVEMKQLTNIGNDYKIRHHEKNRIKITSVKHIDYLFYRMMSLISLFVSYI
ncbi:AbiJ-NTD4 domain-containing protein [Clostridium gasigenes]|uniref:HEPN AbiJ-N-terminal domain-containing protein n=1 Tax=Clostridium gasigenes TaxID=94869 RepID=A0A1H0VD10_9CLOT|nr:hypothetical protein [Clostridium gasigenes]SDP76243.1 hypothetical protein SAMN04488529_11586 [Clostridium gasigenes]